jgi:uncharacterized protein
VLAMGNTIVYRDTYEQALAALIGGGGGAEAVAASAPAASPPEGAAPAPTAAAPADPKLAETIRGHLGRYRRYASEGRWAEAGRELEAIEKLVGR